MNMQEINRKLHEALGKCWHTRIGGWLHRRCTICGNIGDKNPDYISDPRLVIEAMRENPEIDFDSFLVECGSLSRHGRHLDCILLDLIMDKTGRLAKLALEWLGKEKEK